MNHLTGKSGTLRVVWRPAAGIGQLGRSVCGRMFGRSSSLGPMVKVVPIQVSVTVPPHDTGLTSISKVPHQPVVQLTTPVDALITPGDGTKGFPGIGFVILHSREA